MDIKKTLTTTYELTADQIVQLIKQGLDLPNDVKVVFDVHPGSDNRMHYVLPHVRGAKVTVQGK